MGCALLSSVRPRQAVCLWFVRVDRTVCCHWTSLFGVRSFVVIASHCSESDTQLPDSRHCSISGPLPPVAIIVRRQILCCHCMPLFTVKPLSTIFTLLLIVRPFSISCPSLFSARSFAVVASYCSASSPFLPVSCHCSLSDLSRQLTIIVQCLCRSLHVEASPPRLCRHFACNNKAVGAGTK